MFRFWAFSHERDPARRVNPPWDVYMADRVTLPGRSDNPPSHPTYHVNVIKIKYEIIGKGGLPHLPGVPHLHVNRP